VGCLLSCCCAVWHAGTGGHCPNHTHTHPHHTNHPINQSTNQPTKQASKPPQPIHPCDDRQGLGAVATSTAALGLGQPASSASGAGPGGGVDSRRFKMVVQRLMRISLVVTMTWMLALSLDVATWALFFQNRLPPNSMSMVRLAALRSIGLMDAIILGNLFQVRVAPRAKEEGALSTIRLDWIGLDWIGLDGLGFDWIGFWLGLDGRHALSLSPPVHHQPTLTRISLPFPSHQHQHNHQHNHHHHQGLFAKLFSLFQRVRLWLSATLAALCACKGESKVKKQEPAPRRKDTNPTHPTHPTAPRTPHPTTTPLHKNTGRAGAAAMSGRQSRSATGNPSPSLPAPGGAAEGDLEARAVGEREATVVHGAARRVASLAGAIRVGR
jgi:hypothetical protein